MTSKRDDLLEVLKQNNFSNRDLAFVFSELRKFIETGSKDRKTLKFYCDWLLHSKKDRFHIEMKQYIKEIYENAVKHIMNPMLFEYSSKINELIYFKVLKDDLNAELKENGIPTNITSGENWLNLVRTLVKLLEGQPLVKPIPEVDSIEFVPAAEGAAILVIRFFQPVTDRQGKQNHYYKIGNYY